MSPTAKPHSPEITPLPGNPPGPDGRPVGVMVDGQPCRGWPTPSGKLEFFSRTLYEWGWPEYAIPTYIDSHVAPSVIDREAGEMTLLPNYRIPTLIHTRSGNAKWLNEISHSNPLWLHPSDARRIGVTDRRPGPRRDRDRLLRRQGLGDRGTAPRRRRLLAPPRPLAARRQRRKRQLVVGQGVDRGTRDSVYLMRQTHGVRAVQSTDPDSKKIWWSDAGVHQNLTFPVQPDPISGAHAWHQRVRVVKASPDDQYGDIMVDTKRSREAYRRWLEMTRPAPGPGNLRRPLWLLRPFKPDPSAFQIDGPTGR